eukprot:4491258-Pyramimonas_sp.AAC.2
MRPMCGGAFVRLVLGGLPALQGDVERRSCSWCWRGFIVVVEVGVRLLQVVVELLAAALLRLGDGLLPLAVRVSRADRPRECRQ